MIKFQKVSRESIPARRGGRVADAKYMKLVGDVLEFFTSSGATVVALDASDERGRGGGDLKALSLCMSVRKAIEGMGVQSRCSCFMRSGVVYMSTDPTVKRQRTTDTNKKTVRAADNPNDRAVSPLKKKK